MIYTNKNNIAPEFAEALIERQKKYRHEGDYSVTELLNSPRQVHLLRRHHEEIETDVSDLLSSWVGHLIHDAIEMDLPRANMEIDGVMVSGVCDFYKDGILKDYKTTTSWSIIYGSNKEKWEQQLNIYAYLYNKVYRWEVNELYVEAFVTDWQYGKAKFDKSYPQSRQFKIPIKMWDHDYTYKFIYNRLRDLRDLEGTPDEELPHCTMSEMWAKPDIKALMKKGRKRAVRLFTPEEQDAADRGSADQIAGVRKSEIDGERYWWEERKGERTKCERFCSQAQFCSQFKEYNEQG